MTIPPAEDPRREQMLRARRRHIRVLGVATVLMLLAGVYAVGILVWKLPSPMDLVAAGDPCRADAPAITPAKGPVTVQVLNASGKTGMAKTVGDQLAKDGFKVTAPADADSDPDAGVEAEIHYGKGFEAQALTASKYFTNAEVELDKGAGSTVRIVLGKEFKKLVADKQAKAAMTPQPMPCGLTPATPAAIPKPTSTQEPTKAPTKAPAKDDKKDDKKDSDKDKKKD